MSDPALLPVASTPATSPTIRRRADLRWRRIIIALLVAPLLGTLVMHLLITLITPGSVEPMRKLAFWTLAPSLWSLLCGLAYLQTVTRMRRRIGRVECLLLGCVSGFLLPFAMEFGTNLLFMQFWTPHWNWEDTPIFSFLGLITLPFGLFGGWVFWRFGIRPAITPMRDLAPVFD
jgi:hypothetical protein